ncbi:MAG: hypothetical protein IJL66_08815 [Lachnospiraceae bacterium]|nr:hypothetical protein [Lachnospiraceae bacterium]
MEERKSAKSAYEAYLGRTHFLGRLFTVIVLLLLLAAPFVIGLYLSAAPNVPACLKAFLGVGLVYLISGIVEYLIYVPMLGAGGSYLAFITGNLINMKVPCAINAKDIVGVKSGTPENEIISTLSIATSSLVTIVVLALGVLLMIPLQPVLQSPALQPAFANVVPALFGAMACKYYRADRKVALIVLTVMTLLFALVPSLIGSTSMMVIPSGALAIVLSYLSFRKAKKA